MATPRNVLFPIDMVLHKIIKRNQILNLIINHHKQVVYHGIELTLENLIYHIKRQSKKNHVIAQILR